MHRITLATLAATLSLLLSKTLFADTPTTTTASIPIPKTFLEHFASLKNYSAEYTAQLLATLSPDEQKALDDTIAQTRQQMKGSSRSISIPSPLTHYHGTFSLLNNSLASTIAHDENPETHLPVDETPALLDESWIITPNRIEYANTENHAGFIASMINQMPSYLLIDLALGLRAFDATKPLSDLDWSLCDYHPLTKTTGTLTRATLNHIDQWTFDTTTNAITAYTRKSLFSQPIYEIQCSDFRLVANQQLPFKIIFQHFSQAPAPPHVNSTLTLTIKSCALNSPDNTQDRYQMLWPKDSEFLDTRTNQHYSVDHPRTYTDEQLAAELTTRTPKPPSQQ